MKQAKAIVFTTILTLLAFGAIVYTSCKKDRCKDLVCQNGGTCNEGFCICAPGYTGTYCQTANVSNVFFRNNTFTPVDLLIKGKVYRIDSGKTKNFTGNYGDSLVYKASTKGTYGINVEMGTFTAYFPQFGTVAQDLNIDSVFFFLKAVNNPTSTIPLIQQVYTNLGTVDSMLDVASIPNDGKVQNIGYYKYRKGTRIKLVKTPDVFSFTVNATPALNQAYTAIVP